jgi:hypothetical protein
LDDRTVLHMTRTFRKYLEGAQSMIQVLTPLALAVMSFIGKKNIDDMAERTRQAEELTVASAKLFSASNAEMTVEDRWGMLQSLRQSPTPLVRDLVQDAVDVLAETCGNRCNLLGVECSSKADGDGHCGDEKSYDVASNGQYNFHRLECRLPAEACWRVCILAKQAVAERKVSRAE